MTDNSLEQTILNERGGMSSSANSSADLRKLVKYDQDVWDEIMRRHTDPLNPLPVRVIINNSLRMFFHSQKKD